MVDVIAALVVVPWLAVAPPADANSEAESQGPPAPAAEIHDTVVVTASRKEESQGEAISLVSVVPEHELRTSPALVLDDQLRQLPGFSLFRRAGSLAAHPTTQGVSLRGIAPSGTSRTLVLFDGTPLNDPFGGWITWNRLPRLMLEDVEISRGAGSALYGSSALGGVIQLLPREPEETAVDVSLKAGERDIYGAEGFVSRPGEPWGGTLSGGYFHSAGYNQLRPQDRGAVDRSADLAYGSLVGRLYRDRFRMEAQLYREERGNGTVLQENSTQIAHFKAGMRGTRWEWDLYGQDQELDSKFSRVLPDRDEEILTADQHFPSRGMGGSVTWRPADGWLAGADLRRGEWEGVAQDLTGVFVQKDLVAGPRLRWLVGGRFDVWENADTETSFNPRMGVVYRASSVATLRASAYRGFRAPTLNELYRPFRVGNVETLANPELQEERLVGAELGLDLVPRREVLLRLNSFWNELDGSVGNVTIAITPDGILRQRDNLGAVRVAGGEAEVVTSWKRWTVRAAYLYSDSEVEDTGLVLPQAPRSSASLRVEYNSPFTVVLQSRYMGSQFEDDSNELPLAAATLFDLYVEHPLAREFTVSLAVENIFDETVEVGRLPELRVGPPRLVHLNVQFSR